MALMLILRQQLKKDHLDSFGAMCSNVLQCHTMVIRLVIMQAGSGQTLTYTIVNSQASVTEPSPGVFGHFAAEWFPAMMSAVLGNADEAAEEGIHILLLDVCLTCLSWPALFPAVHKASPSLSPQVKLAADALMDYLVSWHIHGVLPEVAAVTHAWLLLHTSGVQALCGLTCLEHSFTFTYSNLLFFPGATCLHLHANSAKMRAAVPVAAETSVHVCGMVCRCEQPTVLSAKL